MSGLLGRLRAALAAHGATMAMTPEDDPSDPPEVWARSNYRGRTVDLRGGPALVAGLLMGAASGRPGGGPARRARRGPAGPRRDPAGTRLVEQAAALAIAAAAAAGLADDLKGDRSARGLKGHFRRLRQGQVTTGLVKLVAVGAGAAIFATVNQFAGQTSPARPRPRRRSLAGRLVMAAADAALVAGAANLVNLLDLRPGRALKAAGATAALLAAAPGAGGGLAAGAVGAALAAAPGDLAEQTMLGDCGANALGACVGAAAVMSLPRPARMAAAAAVAGLILASEKLSFSQVIAANPTLRRIDDWGREDSPADGSAGEQG